MSDQSQELAVAYAFANHVRMFHQALPTEEQHLLEQVFALATIAAGDGQDTKGHGANEIAIESLLGLGSVGPRGFSWSESQTGTAFQQPRPVR